MESQAEEEVVPITVQAQSSFRGLEPPEQKIEAEIPAATAPGQEDELEVTAEGTARGPLGLKKILFVRHKPKTEAAKPPPPTDGSPSLNDRLSHVFSSTFGSLSRATKTGTGGRGDANAGASATAAAAAPEPSPAAPPAPTPPVPQVVTEHFREVTVTFQEGPLPFGFADAAGSVVVARGSSNGSSPEVPVTGAVLVAVAGQPLASGSTAASVAAALDGEATAWPLSLRFRDRIPASELLANNGGGGGGGASAAAQQMSRRVGRLVGNLLGKDGVSPAADNGAAAPPEVPPVPTDVFELSFPEEIMPFRLAQMGAGEGIAVDSVDESYAPAPAAAAEPEDSSGEGGGAGDGEAASEGGGAGAGVKASNVQTSRVENGEEDGVLAAVLAPGAVLLAVGDAATTGLTLEAVQKLLAAAPRPVRLRFRRAPPVFRPAEIAAASASSEPPIHVATWFPLLKRRGGLHVALSAALPAGAGGAGGGPSSFADLYSSDEWEGVHETSARALRFLESFRAHGIPVRLLDIQTALLPRRASGGDGDPYAGAFEGRAADLCQAARLWFCFPQAKTVSVEAAEPGAFGLSAVKGTGGGSWLIVAAAAGSACAAAGVPPGRNLILTHVNGCCVSPAAYRSLAPPLLAPDGGPAGPLTFDAVVAPLLAKAERVSLTLV